MDKNQTQNFLSALTLILLLFLCISMFIYFDSSKKEYSDVQSTITVTGSSELKVKPDYALFSVTASFTEDTSSLAQMKANEMISQAVSMLSSLGVNEENITTGYISISSVRQWNSELRDYVTTGQKAEQSIDITLNDLSLIGQCYSMLGTLDGISVSNVTLDKKNKDADIEEARRLAARDALDKAELYASELGMKVDSPISISASEAGYDRPLLRNTMLMSAAPVMDSSAESGSTTSYYEDDITVSNSISVTFLLAE